MVRYLNLETSVVVIFVGYQGVVVFTASLCWAGTITHLERTKIIFCECKEGLFSTLIIPFGDLYMDRFHFGTIQPFESNHWTQRAKDLAYCQIATLLYFIFDSV